MRWLGEDRLQINSRPYPPREIQGTDLLLVPVTPRRGWLTWDEPHQYAVVYPCDGVRAAGRTARGGAGGGAPAPRFPRKRHTPGGPTGQGLGSVGRHLKVLHEAGLIRRRRAGRSVLYRRTEAGESLVRAGGGA